MVIFSSAHWCIIDVFSRHSRPASPVLTSRHFAKTWLPPAVVKSSICDVARAARTFLRLPAEFLWLQGCASSIGPISPADPGRNTICHNNVIVWATYETRKSFREWTQTWRDPSPGGSNTAKVNVTEVIRDATILDTYLVSRDMNESNTGDRQAMTLAVKSWWHQDKSQSWERILLSS